MRFRVGTFVLIVISGLIWWFSRPGYSHGASTPTTHETTQLSKLPDPLAMPAKAPVTFKKAIGDDYLMKPVTFQQHHKLDGPPGNDASPMDRYRGLKISDEVTLNGRHQKVLGARAVPTSNYNSSFGPVLFEKNGYSIVAMNTANDPQWNDLVMHDSDRPVIVNASNGRLGIVTGTLMIKFSDIHQADKLAGRENLQLLSLDESIGVGYFKAPENYQLLSAQTRLSTSPDVLRVELEVVEAFKGAW
jgi:hypothetical protein